ncbi:hypothetical protein AAY473_017205 [Plecturocebus cupreus]
MAGLRVPAFNAGVRRITPSRVEATPPEATSSGMHREPLSLTPVADCESQCRETTGPIMPCAPGSQRPEAVGVRLSSPRVPPGPNAAGAYGLQSFLPPTRKSRGRGRRLRPSQAMDSHGTRGPEVPGGFRKFKRPQRESGHRRVVAAARGEP